jgi:hypothetical protein
MRFRIMSFLEVIRILCSHHAFCAVIRLLCIHRAFYAVTCRRSSPGQGVSGLSLSRRNEGLEVGSR